jgi:hypothetical protein
MPEKLLRAAADEWADALADLRVEVRGTVVVAGPDAEGVAEVLQQTGAPWVLAQGDGFALLGPEKSTVTAGSLDEVPDGAADLVVLVRAWTGRSDLVRTLDRAARTVAAGGAVVTAEVDFNRLRSARGDRYPAAFFYGRHREIAAAIAPHFVATLDLTIEVNRAGFRSTAVVGFDRPVGRYLDRDLFLAEAPSRWRGFERLTDEEAEAERSALATAIGRLGPGDVIVDREPWTLVAGRKPGRG